MRRLSSALPSPAMLVALLALFVALGGSAYAVKAANAPANSVVTKSIKKGAVTRLKLADGAVGANQLLAGAVGGPQIANGGVGTAQLADGAVTAAKLSASTLPQTTYTVRRETVDHTFAKEFGQFQLLVSCLPGESVTGGGGRTSNGRISLGESIPFVGTNEQRWGVNFYNGSSEDLTAQVTAYVVCASS